MTAKKSTWDGFAEAVASKSLGRGRCVCAVKLFLDSLPPPLRAKVLAVIENPGVYGSVVAKEIKLRVPNSRITENIINRHRRGACACSEETP